MDTKHQEVQDYYGKELTESSDLKTNACCTLVAPPKHILEVLRQVHDEVQAKYYGCGLTIPYDLEGRKILDLGSGSGRDCYIASKLVGQDGAVVGVDMTDEQLDVANKYIDYHTEAFGFKHDAYRLLKPGGEMYFSDVYCDRRIPQHLQDDPVLWGECLSGAMYWNDFHKTARNAGFTDPRTVENKPVTVENEELEEKLGDLKFFSVTYRLFKIEALEEDCEDYGQAIRYKGTIKGNTNSWDLDDHHNFPTGKIMPVCGNTYMMAKETRFAEHFDFFGDFSTHYGIFEGSAHAIVLGRL